MASLSIALHIAGALMLAQPLFVLLHGAISRARLQHDRVPRSRLVR